MWWYLNVLRLNHPSGFNFKKREKESVEKMIGETNSMRVFAVSTNILLILKKHPEKCKCIGYLIASCV